MKFKAPLIAALLTFSWATAQAHDPRCNAPPYGDTQQNYDTLSATYTKAGQSQPTLPPNLITTMMLTTVIAACEAKFGGGDRELFHSAGLSDLDIDTLGTAAMTNAWFASRNRAL